ncbi:MAG: COX15/CtaA family protein [Gemmatimonadales bacterium]
MQFLRLSITALVLAFAQIVFGAVVRITGSGMGCGDHWPKCAGAWFPPHDRVDLIIEITHRYIALALSIVVVALFIMAFTRRSERGVGGPGGVLRPAGVTAALVITAALLGAVTVKMALNPFVIAAHLTIAMSLLATLALVTIRAGGLGGTADTIGTSLRTFRAARLAVGLTLLTLVFGALTANIPDSAASCGGFPWCRTVNFEGLPLVVQVVHRLQGFLLFGHLLGMAIAVGRRGEPRVIVRATRLAFGAALLQVLIAAAMIEMHFPAAFRSLHQAFGTLVWLAVVVLAILSARATGPDVAEPALRRAA